MTPSPDKSFGGVSMHLAQDISIKSASDYTPEDAALLCGVGRIVCAWSILEQSLETKIAMLREGMGDVRTVGSRTRPSMAKLITEMRTMVAMRDRRNAAALHEIAAIERDVQRIDRFRMLVMSGFQAPEPGGFSCRDSRNNRLHISLEQLDSEIAALENVGNRLLAV